MGASRESGVISLTLPCWKYRTLLENDGHLDNVQWVKNENYFFSKGRFQKLLKRILSVKGGVPPLSAKLF